MAQDLNQFIDSIKRTEPSVSNTSSMDKEISDDSLFNKHNSGGA